MKALFQLGYKINLFIYNAGVTGMGGIWQTKPPDA